MVEIGVSVAAKVSEYLVDPVVRPLGYLFNYRTNIEDLSEKVEKLRYARDRQQHSVDEAKRNGREIFDDVPKWLTRADGFIQDASKFLEDEKAARKSCFNGLCPNLKSRYQLSRAARKKAGDADKIHGDGLQIEKVSYRPPLQEIRSAPSEALPSRLLALNEVLEALREEDINKIGVWGLGGVGKSTLVKQVAEQAAQEKLFDKVVTTSVLQTPDLKRIQGELADKLGMKFEEESEEGRAARLHQRMKEEKTILVILDDLWAELELDKIGIPSPADHHKGCKLVLTSRYKDVLLNQMGTQKNFQVEHLKEEESWILFKNRAGDSIEEPDLRPIATEVAKECAGLPIAIVTLATALKNKSLSVWKDAMQQLKTRTLPNISGMETKVYSSLKMSYDCLEGDDVKSFFLLCGLLSNYNAIGDLLKYGVGLQLFEGTNTLEEARDRIDALVERLQSSNLLLHTGDKEIVRMHDVIQNVALEIASKEHHESTFQKGGWSKVNDELKKFSMKYVDVCELPGGLVCTKLELFVCILNTTSAMEIPNTFFEGMKQLKVLDFTHMHLPLLPSSLQCLANLRTLCLDHCELGDIVIIAELKQLEILSLINSDIERLPREIAQLTQLRLLDLWSSSKLKVIPPDVISSFARLEDLGMGNSFTQWEMEGKSNACLAELNHLTLLTSLDIQIPDAKLLPEDRVFNNLVRFKIFIGDVWLWEESYKTDRILKLSKFDTSLLHVVDGMSKLLKRSEDLHLRELCGGTDAVSKLDGEGFPTLKHLKVESSPEIQYILRSMDLTPSCRAFPVMDTLSLNQLINLQEVISHGEFPTGSFGCLRKVEVEDCDGLIFLFSLFVGRSLSKLEEIRVSRCKNMVEMVSRGWEEIKEDGIINVPLLFPELKHLTLQELPKLSNILCLFEEEKPVLSNQLEIIRDGQLQLSLGSNLRFLKLEKCMSLVKLFPSSLLQNLEVIIVENCDNLEQLFDLEGLNVDDGHVRLLPKLESLNLNDLPKLRHICNWGSSTNNHFPSASLGNIIFPKLNVMLLRSLPALTSFSPGNNSLQRLQHADLGTPLPVLFAETEIIRDGQLQLSLGSNLRFLKLEKCMSLVKLFPSRLLQNLEELLVENCDNLEQLFDLEGLNVDDGHVGLLPKLESLNLNDLPKLRHICNWGSSTNDHLSSAPVSNIIFPKLNFMFLESLPALTSFSPGNYSLQRLQHADLATPLPVLFAETVAFPHLEYLYIQGVDNVKRIWDDQLPQDSFSKLKEVVVKSCRGLLNIFPSCVLTRSQSLHTLIVRDCISLKEIIAKDINRVLLETTPAFVFPKLTFLLLYLLPELRSLYPRAHTSQWPLLEKLQVIGCRKLNVFAFETPTFEQRHHEGNLHMPLFFIQHVAFPYLKKLSLGYNNDTEIWQKKFSTNPFPRLTVLDVVGYGNILVAIPSFMLQGLHNVEELQVRDCSSVKEVFQLEGLEEEHEVKLLRRLRILELWHLPRLTHLWKENKKPGPNLQSLESLQVQHCDSLINLVPSSATSFQNLATLDVRSCGSLRSLLSPLIAKTLVKLETLIARGSYMMEEIVANEGDQEAVDEITFRKLQHLALVDLPNLTSFSSGGGYIFSFPSLEDLELKGCSKMEIFSPSLLTTPKLTGVKLEDHEWHWQDDLNTTIQSLFRKTHGNVEVKSVELES